MELSALDDNGKPVDWWFLYKVPKLRKAADSASATGYEYLYYDAEVGTLSRSPNLLTDGKGALDLTLNSVFGHPDATTGWVLYNDEMPASASRPDNGNLGHTKGVIVFDIASNTAFWLLHSWPKYADPGALGMPTPMYGQTFLCVSLDVNTAGKIAAQMIHDQEPQSYFPRIPASLNDKDPLRLVTQPFDFNTPGDSSVLDVSTRGGLKFKVIAKNRNWKRDFWNDLVGPALGADMYDETWIRGPVPPMLDSDGIHKTFDIKYIDLRPIGAPWTWPETSDHAKWGITSDSDWVCIGDLNRMVSQEKRGGGTIALQDKNLWTALSKTDLIVAPPGHSEDEAVKAIQATHPDPTATEKKFAQKRMSRGSTTKAA